MSNPSSKPSANPLVAALPSAIPFVAPEETERQTGRPFTARLGANEGNFGPSPDAIEAMKQAAQHDAWKYPDPTGFALRTAIAEKTGSTIEQIVLGPGIDGLLGLTVRIFSNVGDAIVTSLGAYPTFNYHVNGYGRRLLTVPYAGFHEDLDGLAAVARRHSARIVYLSNPDNPMGTWHSAEAVRDFAGRLPPACLLVLDEAYGETAPQGTIPQLGSLPANVIRMRTFSKAYGLAGLRCGYVIGDGELIAHYNKVRDHFGVSVIAQAGALAAYADTGYLAHSLTSITEARARIASIAMANDLAPIPSATNFVTLDTGRDAAFANLLAKSLMDARIFVRKPMAPGLDHCVRISVGRPEELDWFETALPDALSAADSAAGA